MSSVDKWVIEACLKELKQFRLMRATEIPGVSWDTIQNVIMDLAKLKEDLHEVRSLLSLLEKRIPPAPTQRNDNGSSRFGGLVEIIEVKMPPNGTRRIVKVDDSCWRVELIIGGSWNVEAGPWRSRRSAERYVAKMKQSRK